MDFNILANNHIVHGKLGRYVEFKSEPLWEFEGDIKLFVQKEGDITLLLTPSETNWAEYTPENYSTDFNCFENEGYYLQIIDWKL